MTDIRTAIIVRMMNDEQVQEFAEIMVEALGWSATGNDISKVMQEDHEFPIDELRHVLAKVQWHQIRQAVIDGHFDEDVEELLRMLTLSNVFRDHNMMHLLEEGMDWDFDALLKAGAKETTHIAEEEDVEFSVLALSCNEGLDTLYWWGLDGVSHAIGPFNTADEAMRDGWE